MGATQRLGRVTAAAALALLPACVGATAAEGAAPRPWNLRQARVPAAQAAGRGGAGVTVAVLDTWVDAHHSGLRHAAVSGADCVGGCHATRATPRDPCDHGTHVAGLIASTAYGVAPSATLLPVRVLGYDKRTGACTGSARDVAAGIRWAVAHHARVLNLSVGTLRASSAPAESTRAGDPVAAAIRDAARHGVVVVVAAGNSGTALGSGYDAAAIVVGATGPTGRLAAYSERGPAVDVAAPGGDTGARGPATCRPTTCVASTLPHGRYGLLEGTSMAAAEVSGVAALVIAARPRLTATAVVDAVESTARPVAGVRFGAVDAAAAVAAVLPGRTAAARGRAADDASTAGAAPAAGDGSGAPHSRTGLAAITIGAAAALAAGAVRSRSRA